MVLDTILHPVAILVYLALFLAIAKYSYQTTVKACYGNDVDNVPYLFTSDTDENKLVVILGWGGSTQKHLRRIVEAYREQNISVLSYTSPWSFFLDQGLSLRALFPLMDKLFDHVSSLSPERKSNYNIYIHAHSNTGAISYIIFKSLLIYRYIGLPDFSEIKGMISGIIYDSSPLVVALRSAVKVKVPEEYTSLMRDFEHKLVPFEKKDTQELKLAFPDNIHNNLFKEAFHLSLAVVSNILRRNVYLHPFWTPATTLSITYIYLRSGVFDILRKYKIITSPKYSLFPDSFPNYQKEYFTSTSAVESIDRVKTMKDAKVEDFSRVISYHEILEETVKPLKNECLFLYSNNDKLCTDKDIERIQYVFISKGIPVYQRKFKGSAHVQHLLKNEDSYKEALFDFIKLTKKTEDVSSN